MEKKFEGFFKNFKGNREIKLRNSEIHKFCKESDIYHYSINNDGSLDIDGDLHYRVMLNARNINKISTNPITFNKVSGSVFIAENKIKMIYLLN